MSAFGWPSSRPPVAYDKRGYFDEQVGAALAPFLAPGAAVVEVGSFLGSSARWLADRVASLGVAMDSHTNAQQRGRVYCIDTWPAGVAWEPWGVIDSTWDRFLSNCWGHRGVIRPIRGDSSAGLRTARAFLSHREPSLIYVDGGHGAPQVERDLLACFDLFPSTPIVGDDYATIPGVRAGLDAALLRAPPGRLQFFDRCFTFEPARRAP